MCEAAQRVYARDGLVGLSVRAVAAEAGYSPGALYSYVPGKSDLLGEVLSGSLLALARALKETDGEADARALLSHRICAYLDFYHRSPAAFDLFLHLFQANRAGALSSGCERRLNGRLIAVLTLLADPLRRVLHLGADAASRETLILTAALNGILLFDNAGRTALFGLTPQDLAGTLVERLGPPRPDPPARPHQPVGIAQITPSALSEAISSAS